MIIYRIIFPNGKNYIGATTKTLKIRSKSHIAASNSGSDYPVHSALRKYKTEVQWEILHNCESLNDLSEKEKYYISFYKSTIKENGYNVKPAGFYVTGTHGKTLSQKRKEFFLNEKNRIQSSIDHGGESFFVYSLLEQKFIGKWINQSIAAEFLNITTKHLQNALSGRSKTAKNFIMIKEKELYLLPKILEKVPKLFKSIHKETGIEKKWLSKSKCSRELNIPREFVYRLLETGKILNRFEYRFEYCDIKDTTNLFNDISNIGA